MKSASSGYSRFHSSIGFDSSALSIRNVGFLSARFSSSARSRSKSLSTGVSTLTVFAIVFPQCENTRTAGSRAGEDVYGRKPRLPRQQRADVTQQLVGAHRAVA